MKIQDKVAIVTGAASGIGKAAAERFSAEGAKHVVAADLNGDGARQVASMVKIQSFLFTLIKSDDAVLISLGKQDISFRNSKTREIFDLPLTFVENVLKPIEVDEKLMLFNF